MYKCKDCYFFVTWLKNKKGCQAKPFKNPSELAKADKDDKICKFFKLEAK